ncbi:MAG TPA: L-aspartate oxidase, partial [Thermodesulfobacteriota bacterium]|nr:L-aspartate oxidase [Thermodesulfobacteriota bacterium]
SFDFLVVGSGLAGLYASLYASKFGEVALLTKSTLEESNSYWAQGGIAAAMDPEDSPLFHLEDTIKAGRSLCNEEAVRILVQEGRDRVTDLIAQGMKFDYGEKGLELGLEGGHSKRRVLHAGGSSTGKEMVQFLISSVKANPNVYLFENTVAIELISDGMRCFGALLFKEDNGEQIILSAKSTILATGGASGIYLRTTNPPSAIGDGIALAYRAGAEVSDMEFIQFHPTALYTEQGGTFLISEAVRGEGAYLLNHSGDRFMPDYHELAELAPRDIVSRAIFNEIKKSGENHAFLTLKHLNADFVKKRFSNIYNACLIHGIDITRDLVPVAPAAHYFIGGVKTRLMAETNIKGLYACGEVACTGVHGANRLASNSLLECIVFAKRAVDGAIEKDGSADNPADPLEHSSLPQEPFHSASSKEGYLKLKNIISGLMTDYVGIVRSGEGLKKALVEVEKAADSAYSLTGYYRLKLQNMLDVCTLITKSALIRTESRGGHIREDFPDEDPSWKAHIVWRKDAGYKITAA